MKKAFAIILIGCLLFSLSGCSISEEMQRRKIDEQVAELTEQRKKNKQNVDNFIKDTSELDHWIRQGK